MSDKQCNCFSSESPARGEVEPVCGECGYAYGPTSCKCRKHLAAHPPAKLPEGWNIRRRPSEGRIQIDSPDGDHCMLERREQMAPHHPMNMFYELAEALISASPQIKGTQ